MSESARAVFRVGGLSGDEGSREIEDTLAQIDGVHSVDVSLPDSTVDVYYDPGVIREEYIERTLNSLGYSPYV
ncbi:MAG: heavy-metal-associated domain-containing protein, partial [Firmicutes bacterium]|nr:heavy-metal-associated domain-containing protein [Bacillota bacterium]